MKRLIVAPCFTVLALLTSEALADIPTPPNYRISSPSGQIQNEEQIWVDPTDSTILIALWRDFRLGYRRLGVGRSTDGGNTWTDSLIRLTKYDKQSDPAVDVDRNGNFYLAMLDFSEEAMESRSCLTFLKSTDKGQSWIGPIVIEGPYGLYFEDKEFITIDRTGGPHDGNLYVAWARFTPNFDEPCAMMFARSTDFESGFDEPVIFDPPYDTSICGYYSLYTGEFAQPIVGSDGAVYIFWWALKTDSLCQAHDFIAMVKSTDGGQTFTEPRMIRPTYGCWQDVDGFIDVYNSPTCAADITGGPYDGNLYVSYGNMDTTNTVYYDWNIEFIRSADGGETWSEPYYINDDYTGPGAMFDQFHPWLFCNQDGVLIIVFYDQRTDPDLHYRFDVFAAYSFNGGESFTANHRISDTSSNPAYLSSGTRAGRIAEYIGVTAFHDHVNAIWTDTRNGDQDAYGANWVIPVLPPRLISPLQGENYSDTISFDWDISWKMDDDTYRLEISRDSLFGSLAFSAVMDSADYQDNCDFLFYGAHYWRVKAFKISTGDSSGYSETGEFFITSFICGDVNSDGSGNMLDILYLIAYLYKYGPEPMPPESANVNNDGAVDMLDILYLIAYLYKGGPSLECP
jgi:hypothetical protein